MAKDWIKIKNEYITTTKVYFTLLSSKTLTNSGKIKRKDFSIARIKHAFIIKSMYYLNLIHLQPQLIHLPLFLYINLE